MSRFVRQIDYTMLRLAMLLAAIIVSVSVRASVQQPEPAAVDSILDIKVAVPVDNDIDNDFDFDNDIDNDSITNVVTFNDVPGGWKERRGFNPDPNRALWLSALLPGLGQIYNRRYWKLPIVVGGFMGLGYATSWNNNQLNDYMQAYRDATDDDPNTKSYMNLFPPTTTEDQLDMNWLQQTLKSRKDYYRRNRDLCIISVVGLYLICMLDAYVDASLSHFDISENLSLDLHPAVIIDNPNRKPSWGLTWALNF